MGQPRPLFNLFSSFQKHITIFKKKKCEIMYAVPGFELTTIHLSLKKYSGIKNRGICAKVLRRHRRRGLDQAEARVLRQDDLRQGRKLAPHQTDLDGDTEIFGKVELRKLSEGSLKVRYQPLE